MTEARNTLWRKVKRNRRASSSRLHAVAADATAMLCRLIILPITPPRGIGGGHQHGVHVPAVAVTTCRLPNSALAEVSLPVRNTPSQPSRALKNGNDRAGGGERQAQRRRWRRSSSSGTPAPSTRRHGQFGQQQLARGVHQNTLANCRGPCAARTRRAIAAIKQAVPGAESQLKLIHAPHKAWASRRRAACAGSHCAAPAS